MKPGWYAAPAIATIVSVEKLKGILIAWFVYRVRNAPDTPPAPLP